LGVFCFISLEKERDKTKPGFPLQVLAPKVFGTVGFPLQSLTRGYAEKTS
jgi:hypothetical protein